MALGTAAAIGAGLGGLSGLLSKKDQGRDAGNVYANQGMQQSSLDAMKNAMANQPTSAGAQQAVQSSPIFGQMFGQDGTLSRTVGEEQDLASRGYSLQPEDYEAYGQAAGNTARMFGQQEKSLAQALSDRGMGNSGSAAMQFSGLQGNKMEQLGGLQRQIADQRMKMNMERLGQTRNFLSQMGNQAQQAVQGEFGREMDTNQNQYNQANQYLGNVQDTNNQNIQQQQQTARSSDMSNALQGTLGGFLSGANIDGAFSAKKPTPVNPVGLSKPLIMGGQAYNDPTKART